MQARLVFQQPSRSLALAALFAAAIATLLLGLELGVTFKAPSIVQAPSKVIVVPAYSGTISDDCYMAPRHLVC